MFRNLLSLGLVCVFSVPSFCFAVEVITLTSEDLPQLVKSRNQSVTGSGVLVEAAQARQGHLVRSFLPTLHAEVGGENFKTGHFERQTQPYGGVEAKINVFRGGRDSLEDQQLSNLTFAAESSAKKTFEEELTQARKLYWIFLFNKEMIKNLEDSVAQGDKFLEMANRRIARGLSTETDRLDFQIHRAQLKEDIESLTHENMLLQMSLASVLGMRSDTLFNTAEKIVHVHDESLLKSAFDPLKHPAVVTLKMNQENFEGQKRQANRWWTPSLDLYGGAFLHTLRERDYLERSLRYDHVVGIKLSFELFDGLQSKADARASSLQSEAFAQMHSQKKRAIETQVQVAKEDLKHDHDLIHHAEERIEQGKVYLSRVVSEYDRGVKNSIDVLGAVQRFASFQRQYAERRKNYQITRSGLQALLGQ